MIKKTRLTKTAHILIIMALSISLTGCNNTENTSDTQRQAQSQPAPEPIRTLHKTIDVEITEIKCTWRDNRGASFNVSYKSDEYGVSSSMNNISNWTGLTYYFPIFNDIIHISIIFYIYQ